MRPKVDGGTRLDTALTAGRVLCDAGVDRQVTDLLRISAGYQSRAGGRYGASRSETPD
jgi:hypothetical protein